MTEQSGAAREFQGAPGWEVPEDFIAAVFGKARNNPAVECTVKTRVRQERPHERSF